MFIRKYRNFIAERKPTSAHDTLGSVRERIAIFETFSTDRQPAEVRLVEGADGVQEPITQAREPEGPSHEASDEPQAVIRRHKGEQDSTGDETGKSFSSFPQVQEASRILSSSTVATGHVEAALPRQHPKEYGDDEEEIRQYGYSMHGEPMQRVQDSVRLAHVTDERVAQTGESAAEDEKKMDWKRKEEQPIKVERLSRWEHEEQGGPSQELEAIMQKRLQKIADAEAETARRREELRGQSQVPAAVDTDIEFHEWVGMDKVSEEQEVSLPRMQDEVHVCEGWEIIEAEEVCMITNEYVAQQIEALREDHTTPVPSEKAVSVTDVAKVFGSETDLRSITSKSQVEAIDSFGVQKRFDDRQDGTSPKVDIAEPELVLLECAKEIPIQEKSIDEVYLRRDMRQYAPETERSEQENGARFIRTPEKEQIITCDQVFSAPCEKDQKIAICKSSKAQKPELPFTLDIVPEIEKRSFLREGIDLSEQEEKAEQWGLKEQENIIQQADSGQLEAANFIEAFSKANAATELSNIEHGHVEYDLETLARVKELPESVMPVSNQEAKSVDAFVEKYEMKEYLLPEKQDAGEDLVDISFSKNLFQPQDAIGEFTHKKQTDYGDEHEELETMSLLIPANELQETPIELTQSVLQRATEQKRYGEDEANTAAHIPELVTSAHVTELSECKAQHIRREKGIWESFEDLVEKEHSVDGMPLFGIEEKEEGLPEKESSEKIALEKSDTDKILISHRKRIGEDDDGEIGKVTQGGGDESIGEHHEPLGSESTDASVISEALKIAEVESINKLYDSDRLPKEESMSERLEEKQITYAPVTEEVFWNKEHTEELAKLVPVNEITKHSELRSVADDEEIISTENKSQVYGTPELEKDKKEEDLTKALHGMAPTGPIHTIAEDNAEKVREVGGRELLADTEDNAEKVREVGGRELLADSKHGSAIGMISLNSGAANAEMEFDEAKRKTPFSAEDIGPAYTLLKQEDERGPVDESLENSFSPNSAENVMEDRRKGLPFTDTMPGTDTEQNTSASYSAPDASTETAKQEICLRTDARKAEKYVEMVTTISSVKSEIEKGLLERHDKMEQGNLKKPEDSVLGESVKMENKTTEQPVRGEVVLLESRKTRESFAENEPLAESEPEETLLSSELHMLAPNAEELRETVIDLSEQQVAAFTDEQPLHQSGSSFGRKLIRFAKKAGTAAGAVVAAPVVAAAAGTAAAYSHATRAVRRKRGSKEEEEAVLEQHLPALEKKSDRDELFEKSDTMNDLPTFTEYEIRCGSGENEEISELVVSETARVPEMPEAVQPLDSFEAEPVDKKILPQKDEGRFAKDDSKESGSMQSFLFQKHFDESSIAATEWQLKEIQRDAVRGDVVTELLEDKPSRVLAGSELKGTEKSIVLVNELQKEKMELDKGRLVAKEKPGVEEKVELAEEFVKEAAEGSGKNLKLTGSAHEGLKRMAEAKESATEQSEIGDSELLSFQKSIGETEQESAEFFEKVPELEGMKENILERSEVRAFEQKPLKSTHKGDEYGKIEEVLETVKQQSAEMKERQRSKELLKGTSKSINGERESETSLEEVYVALSHAKEFEGDPYSVMFTDEIVDHKWEGPVEKRNKVSRTSEIGMSAGLIFDGKVDAELQQLLHPGMEDASPCLEISSSAGRKLSLETSETEPRTVMLEKTPDGDQKFRGDESKEIAIVYTGDRNDAV
ncbi:unnamed protein product, partial [Gongylonema pulchrum]|uniref:ANK_REP_REGION domain-containing protein n=1 Tax=Gongylonema pulchrum TaxID=637853 RepID=A0A183EFC6_9BILA